MELQAMHRTLEALLIKSNMKQLKKQKIMSTNHIHEEDKLNLILLRICFFSPKKHFPSITPL